MPLSSTCNRGICSLPLDASSAFGFPSIVEVTVYGDAFDNVVPVSGVVFSSLREGTVPVYVLVYDVLSVPTTLSCGQVAVSSTEAALIDCNNNCCVALSIPVTFQSMVF